MIKILVKSLLLFFTMVNAFAVLLFLMAVIDKIITPQFKNLNNTELTIVGAFVLGLVAVNVFCWKLFRKIYKRINNTNKE